MLVNKSATVAHHEAILSQRGAHCLFCKGETNKVKINKSMHCLEAKDQTKLSYGPKRGEGFAMSVVLMKRSRIRETLNLLT